MIDDVQVYDLTYNNVVCRASSYLDSIDVVMHTILTLLYSNNFFFNNYILSKLIFYNNTTQKRDMHLTNHMLL